MALLQIVTLFMFMSTTMAEHHQVVIIGAGTSGLAAGTRLIEHGIQNFVILEAENRYGGRVYSQPVGDYMVDFGAQWCHGEKGNVVFEKANSLGMLEHSTFEDTDLAEAIIGFNGSKVNESWGRRAMAILQNLSVDNETNKEAYEGFSVEQYYKAKLPQELSKVENQDIPSHVIRAVWEVFRKYENIGSAYDNWDLAPYEDPWEHCDGDFLLNWKSKTYGAFLDVLIRPNNDVTKKSWARDKVKLEKVVRHIDWNSLPIRIFCEDRSEFTADHVITTVSLGVLKHRQDLFIPKLPSWKINAIENLNMGCVGKFYFTFPNLWWVGEIKNGASFFCEKSEEERLLGNFQGTKDENKWLLEVSGFNLVENKPGIIQSWISGDACRYAETLPSDVVKDKVIKLFRIYLSSYNIPDPVEFKRTTWCTNPHFLGSYSWPGLNTNKANTSASELAKPIEKDGKLVLLFAGEATHPNHYQTVHGAIESGYREADKINEIVQGKKI